MRNKFLACLILFTLFLNSLIFPGNSLKNQDVEDEPKRIIEVAMLGEEPIGWTSAKFMFPHILNGYEWEVGNRTYEMKVTEIFDKDILRGKLNTENFDVLLCPGGGVGDGESIVKGFSNFRRVKKWKEGIENFIKDGGGYSAYCGGVAMITDQYKKPDTFLERQYDKSGIDVTCVSSYYNDVAMYLFYPLQKKYPEKVGAGCYIWFRDQRFEEYADDFEHIMNVKSGASIDMPINKNHPIFDDCIKDTQRITWVGGPGLMFPEDPGRKIDVLGWYPNDGISDNDSTKINAWKYVGGFRGIIKGIIKSIKTYKEKGLPLSLAIVDSYYEFEDWEPTDRHVDLNFSNKPCITAEVYPNENEGRIVLTAHHPEYPVWWGGEIENMPDNDSNSIKSGFFTWNNTIPPDQTSEDELRHNWWMIRRQVAWAAKVPDEDLPPAHGSSQVCDFENDSQVSEFTIFGNAEKSSQGIDSLKLYYRHSTDGNQYTNWTYYSTDKHFEDGWSWEFISPNGTGYYQFYSIRKVEFENHIENEKEPLGPDAYLYVDTV